MIFVRFLGFVEHSVKDGYLIIKPYMSDVLRVVGLVVFDSSSRRVGRVVDVIGKVSDPRIVVKLDNPDLGPLLSSRRERLYYIPRRRSRDKK